MSHEKSIEADEKTVLAVATAMVDSALAHGKTNVFVQARAAIGAYRDAEIERLTAKIEAWETAIDSWMVTNWVGVYDSKKGVSETLSLCLERALDVQRDALRAKLEATERDAERHLSSLRVRAALYAHMLTMSGGEFKEPRDFHCHARDLFQGINALPLRVTKDANEKVAELARALDVSPAGEAAIDAARGGERG